ncbi:hypothetical protein BK133_14230 [Paenibacillus sp. FSL H8-0548]|uniref:hypothetical protein n=1 Tax=Paenibacillus sp. FSL H8-0548 TaxID=1920422 RepID=UPI00096C02CB|nr:hypothetical protein [Paenibacillus sp. FSL H8-0548]OMF32654.1 hypothetical protein BK133_14230 [Paenibacillus sp. FSL H8-0548]
MGLLYEMVIKKRKSALLLQQISWKQCFGSHTSQSHAAELKRSEHVSSAKAQQNVQTNAIFS